jgi:hypothetical protein
MKNVDQQPHHVGDIMALKQSRGSDSVLRWFITSEGVINRLNISRSALKLDMDHFLFKIKKYGSN